MEIPRAKRKPGIIRRFFSALGPGVIAGAADDDPSGIATYSITGAQLGTSLLWTAFITWPLMAAVQFMCARIGMVTGMGLGDALRRKGPPWLLFFGAVALLAANSINVGADLSGMADAASMLTGINSHIYVVMFGVGIATATIRFRYHKIAVIMKWLVTVLFAYVITAFIVGPDWRAVLHDTFIPSLPSDHNGWQTLVALFGTTISPYLFFWQSSQEVEERKAMGRRMLADRLGAKHAITNIETSRQAAEALRPLAGVFASTLYTLGVIGVGILAIPTLTGSAAYAFAETFSWQEGLDEPFRGAIPFYAVVIISTLLGIALDILKINPLKALFYTAVINGVLAPFLLVGILVAASDRKLMQGQPSSWLSRIVVGITTLVMFVAAAAMFIL